MVHLTYCAYIPTSFAVHIPTVNSTSETYVFIGLWATQIWATVPYNGSAAILLQGKPLAFTSCHTQIQTAVRDKRNSTSLGTQGFYFSRLVLPVDPILSCDWEMSILVVRGGGTMAEIGPAYSTSRKRFELRPSSAERAGRHSVLGEVVLSGLCSAHEGLTKHNVTSSIQTVAKEGGNAPPRDHVATYYYMQSLLYPSALITENIVYLRRRRHGLHDTGHRAITTSQHPERTGPAAHCAGAQDSVFVAGDPSVLMVSPGFPQTRYSHLRLRESSDRTQATSESLRPDLPELKNSFQTPPGSVPQSVDHTNNLGSADGFQNIAATKSSHAAMDRSQPKRPNNRSAVTSSQESVCVDQHPEGIRIPNDAPSRVTPLLKTTTALTTLDVMVQVWCRVGRNTPAAVSKMSDERDVKR
ncbi:hypothetical protein KC367_g253 [Hortaea werneckii]|nr:hypothetical protein KC367_g253 [Hortaea werneckii]